MSRSCSRKIASEYGLHVPRLDPVGSLSQPRDFAERATERPQLLTSKGAFTGLCAPAVRQPFPRPL